MKGDCEETIFIWIFIFLAAIMVHIGAIYARTDKLESQIATLQATVETQK